MSSMKIYKKIHLANIGIFSLAAIIIGVIFSTLSPITSQTAHAACENLNGKELESCLLDQQNTAHNDSDTSSVYCDPNSTYESDVATAYSGHGGCFGRTLDYLNQSTNSDPNRQLTPAQFQQKISDCVGGNAGGKDTQNAGSCANAVASCYRKMIDTSSCNANNLADIATHCNGGKSTNDGDCGRINTENQAQFDDLKKQIQQKAVADGACTSANPNSAAAVIEDQNNCKKAAVGNCQPPANYRTTSGGQYNDSGYNDYKTCLNNSLKTSAKDKKECDTRGGRWIADQSGSDGNYVEAGCYANYTDLVNPEACAAGGGVWTKIDDPTNANHYQCNPPAGKNNDGTDKGAGDGTAGPVNGSVDGPAGQCGEARVNLLVCGTDTGNQALNNVLKIIIMVLTILVGVAAVGGLAWAAVMYAHAEDDSGKVSEAKTLIRNVVIGILLYGFLIAIVTWLVPGLEIK